MFTLLPSSRYILDVKRLSLSLFFLFENQKAAAWLVPFMWFSHIWEASEDDWSVGGQRTRKVRGHVGRWISTSVVVLKVLSTKTGGVITSEISCENDTRAWTSKHQENCSTASKINSNNMNHQLQQTFQGRSPKMWWFFWLWHYFSTVFTPRNTQRYDQKKNIFRAKQPFFFSCHLPAGDNTVFNLSFILCWWHSLHNSSLLFYIRQWIHKYKQLIHRVSNNKLRIPQRARVSSALLVRARGASTVKTNSRMSQQTCAFVFKAWLGLQ